MKRTMARGVLFLSTILIYLLTAPAPSWSYQGESDHLRVLLPPDKSVVSGRLIGVVLSTRGNPETILLTVNGRDYPPLRAKDFYICKEIGLTGGMNKIYLRVAGKDGASEGKTLSIFLSSALSERLKSPPPGFRPYHFHKSEHVRECSRCHEMKARKSDANPGSPELSSCYACHKEMTGYKFMHGSVSVWACTSCHSSGNNELGSAGPVSKLCFSCHYNEMKTWTAMKHAHGPFALGACTICHNPHASDDPFFLRKQTTDLCLSCHADKASGAHVVSGFSGSGHPVRGKPDPRNPKKELTCASCHNPHASDFAFLLFKDLGDKSTFCRTCHRF